MNWHDLHHCSSSVQAYLTPVESIRTNWVTLTGHLVRLNIFSLNEEKHKYDSHRSQKLSGQHPVYR